MVQNSEVNSTPSQANTGLHWAPREWDLFSGEYSVGDAVSRKADVRFSISPIELGIDAGRAVLDQYYAAKGDTSMGATVSAALSFQNATNIAALTLPIVGLAAAIGVDFAVFGSAAKDLVPTSAPQVSTPQSSGLLGYFSSFNFNAFAFGSLIFASGLGLAEKNLNSTKKVFFYGTLFIASAGASFIAANNNDFRKHFSDTIKSTFAAGSDPKQAEVDGLKDQIEAIQKKIDEKNKRLSTGGVGGKPLLADGAKGNDDEAKDIIKEIRNLEGEQKQKTANLATATPELNQAKRKDWTDFIGRLLATSYIAAWLIASQLLIAEIVRRSSENYKNLTDKLSQKSKEKKFAKDIEHFDDVTRNMRIRSLVESELSRFSERLSLSKEDPKNPDKLKNFGDLFEEPRYSKMVEAGVSVVKGAVTPRSPTIWERVQSMAHSFNKKASDEHKSAHSQASVEAVVDKNESKSEPEAPSGEERKPA